MGGRSFMENFNSPEWALAAKACEDEDTSMVHAVISMTAMEDLKQLCNFVLMAALTHNSIAILKCLIERGVNIAPRTPTDALRASKETLELLLTKGWDINATRTPYGHEVPFMLYKCDSEDMVNWCLEHGASVHLPDDPFHPSFTTYSLRESNEILEKVSAEGSVATFELLRSHGAPLGWHCLHAAVASATEARDDERYGERMAMVRHLIDVVGLDVNGPDGPRSARPPRTIVSPICYIPDFDVPERDTRELTWLLLDRGADPVPAIKIAEGTYPRFVEDVKAWKAKQVTRSK